MGGMGQGEASWGREPSDSLRKVVTGLEVGVGSRPGRGVGGTDYRTFAAPHPPAFPAIWVQQWHGGCSLHGTARLPTHTRTNIQPLCLLARILKLKVISKMNRLARTYSKNS